MPKKHQLSTVVGSRGENLFELPLTDYRQFDRPLFEAAFLGDKWPAVDYYVELRGVRRIQPVFYAQVKSTRGKLKKSAKMLKIVVPKKKCLSLFRIPGPTYIAAVHEPSRRIFLASIHEPPASSAYNIPVENELTPDRLIDLYKEVRNFWTAGNHKPVQSVFSL